MTLGRLFKSSVPQESENNIHSASIGNILGGLVPGLPADTKICGCSSLLYKLTWQPTPVFLPGKFHGQRSLVGYSPWGRKESDMPE